MGNVSSETLATYKTSGCAGGSAKWRTGTHRKDLQPEQRATSREFLPAVRAQPQKAGRCLLENPGTTSNARPYMLHCPLPIHPSIILSPGTFHVKLLFWNWSAVPSFTPQWLATGGDDLNGDQEGQTGVLQEQLTLEEQRKLVGSPCNSEAFWKGTLKWDWKHCGHLHFLASHLSRACCRQTASSPEES